MQPSRLPSILLLAGLLLAPVATAQTTWTLSTGPATMNHHTFAGIPVPPPFPAFPAPPPIAPFFPPLPMGGDDVNRAAGTLWMTDGMMVVNTTPAGAVIGVFPVPPAVGGPLTGITVDPFTGLLWVTTPVTYASLTPFGALIAVFPIPAALPPPATGIAFNTYVAGGILYIINAPGFIASLIPGGPVLMVTPPPLIAMLPPPYTGIGFDTSVAAPGQLKIASGAAPMVLTLPLPLGAPPIAPPVPVPAPGPLTGLGVDAQPVTLGVSPACPLLPGANTIGFAGGWSVVPNPGFTVTLTGAAPGVAWFLFVSPGVIPAGIPLAGGGGFLYLAPPLFLAGGVTTAAGGAAVPLPIAPGLPIGVVLFFQFASACPAVPFGFVASDYLTVTLCGI